MYIITEIYIYISVYINTYTYMYIFQKAIYGLLEQLAVDSARGKWRVD